MTEKFQVLSTFAGIGAFDLGLERAGGFETVAFSEVDPYCNAVLKKHWPEVKQYHDIRAITGNGLRADGICPNIIVGGFPCTDISTANAAWGEMLGLQGDRSGLFFEQIRLVGEIRPDFVVLENVSNLLGNGLLRVLAEFAALGYDAEWHAIPIAHAGGIQNRDRVWIVAYPTENGIEGLFQGVDFSKARQGWACGQADLPRVYANPLGGDGWPQPLIRRGDNRPPNWVDRIECCGDALCPQIAEEIGRAIMRKIGMI